APGGSLAPRFGRRRVDWVDRPALRRRRLGGSRRALVRRLGLVPRFSGRRHLPEQIERVSDPLLERALEERNEKARQRERRSLDLEREADAGPRAVVERLERELARIRAAPHRFRADVKLVAKQTFGDALRDADLAFAVLAALPRR